LQPLYTEAELRIYLEEDRRLIRQLRPQVVLHDCRWSMGVSARVEGVPLVSVANSHWALVRTPRWLQGPDHHNVQRLASLLGKRFAYRLWDLALQRFGRIGFAQQLQPINHLRLQYDLPPHRWLDQYYSDGDWVAYAEVAALSPVAKGMSDRSRFLGAVLWSPAVELPDWWHEATSCDGVANKPVYITMGSSGDRRLLPTLIKACRELGLRCLVSTAGGPRDGLQGPGIYVADYLPGDKAASAASLVICNGGSATAYQALSQGTPVLGLCSNLDQVLTMVAVRQRGVGEFFRAGQVTGEGLGRDKSMASTLQQVIRSLIYGPAVSKARDLALDFQAHDSGAIVGDLVCRAVAAA
jgi:UDP:flavonoid glycosyltransferase YjiC (YdhE family)